MTVEEVLLSLVSYPVPRSVVENIADSRGLDLTGLTTGSVRSSESLRLAEADIYLFVSNAPDVSEGGITINMQQEQRRNFKRMANAIYLELGDSAYEATNGQIYTYQGTEI